MHTHWYSCAIRVEADFANDAYIVSRSLDSVSRCFSNLMISSSNSPECCNFASWLCLSDCRSAWTLCSMDSSVPVSVKSLFISATASFNDVVIVSSLDIDYSLLEAAAIRLVWGHANSDWDQLVFLQDPSFVVERLIQAQQPRSSGLKRRPALPQGVQMLPRNPWL